MMTAPSPNNPPPLGFFRRSKILLSSIFLSILAAIAGIATLINNLNAIKPTFDSFISAFHAQPSTDKKGDTAISALLQNGQTVSVEPSIVYQVEPQNAPLVAVNFKDEATLRSQLDLAMKRYVLRDVSGLTQDEVQMVRPDLEKKIKTELAMEYMPLGVTIKDFSIGEITPK